MGKTKIQLKKYRLILKTVESHTTVGEGKGRRLPSSHRRRN